MTISVEEDCMGHWELDYISVTDVTTNFMYDCKILKMLPMN